MHKPFFEIITLDNFPRFYEQQASQIQLRSLFKYIWFEEGSGVHTVDQYEYQLLPGHVYSIAPGWHHEIQLQDAAKGFLITFNSAFLTLQKENIDRIEAALLQKHCVMAPELSVKSSNAEEITDVLSLLLKEKQRNSLWRSEIIFRYLKIFMVLLEQQIDTTSFFLAGKTMNRLVDNFLLLLEKNFRERKMVIDYAKELYVTPNYLNNVIKTTTGLTARQHIQQRVLLEAKMEMKRKGTSMKQIAYQLGFENLCHFSKFFKNTAGENFSTFKKQINKAYVTA